LRIAGDERLVTQEPAAGDHLILAVHRGAEDVLGPNVLAVRLLATDLGAVVVSVDYRLAVDGVCYPVPHDDTVAAVAWVRDNADALGIDAGRISIGGASAGANLTAGAVLKLRDRDGWLPRALLFVYGVAHPVVPPPSPALSAALAELPPILAPKAGSRDDFLTVN